MVTFLKYTLAQMSTYLREIKGDLLYNFLRK